MHVGSKTEPEDGVTILTDSSDVVAIALLEHGNDLPTKVYGLKTRRIVYDARVFDKSIGLADLSRSVSFFSEVATWFRFNQLGHAWTLVTDGSCGRR
jgi:hypothetical protein